MAPLLHHRLLPLLAILVAACSHGAPSGDDSYDPSLCQRQPYRCGSVTIQYPFYFYNETALLPGSSSGPDYCGYPGLRILCEDGEQAVLQLGSDNYRVSAIDYENFTISLADQEVSGDESCPRVDYDATIPDSWWLYFPDNTVDFLFFFLNCNLTMEWRPPKTIGEITCPTPSEGPRRSFVALQLQPGDVPYEDWQKNCTRIKLPVLESWNWSNRTAVPFGDAARTGFQLEWDWERTKNSSCDKCEESSGHCGYSQTGQFVACLCSDGRISDRNICSSGKRGDFLSRYSR